MANIQLYELLELIDSQNIYISYIDEDNKEHCITGTNYNDIKPLEDYTVQSISVNCTGTITIKL